MELINIDSTKVISLFQVGYTNGQPPVLQLLTSIAQRYQFERAPSKIEDVLGEKVEFGHGYFSGNSINLLEVFTDGLVVTTRSTSTVVDAFISDLRKWTADQFGLKEIETHNINKVYESNLTFTAKKNPLWLLDKLEPVKLSFQKMLKAAVKIESEYQSFGWTLSPDITTVAGLRPIAFRVERKAGADFASNLYFSTAPLPTSDHLKLLEQLEYLS